MNSTMSHHLPLVFGGTGKTGRRVAARLTAGGLPLRIGSRSGAPRFDWDDPRDSVLSGEVALPAGNTPEPSVDADDIADVAVAVAALIEDGHVGEVHELTGPRLLTFPEAIDEIARETGRDIRYLRVSIEGFAAGAAEQGVPDEVIELLTCLFGEVLDGRNAYVTDGVRRTLGREPRDFRDYVRDAADTGIWDSGDEER